MDRISDQVILLSQGYVVAEGQIQGVRSEVKEQPMQILVRCDRPGRAGRAPVPAGPRGGGQDSAPTAKACCCAPRDADSFYLLLNRVILETGLEVESVAPGR